LKLRQQQLAIFILCSALAAACDPSTPKGGVADAGTTPTTSTKPGTTAPGSGLESDSGAPDATDTAGAGGDSSSAAVTDGDVPPVTTATSSGVDTTSSGVGITSSAGEPLPDAGVAPDGTVPSTKGIVKLRLKVK
jgi:hypothetical protein